MEIAAISTPLFAKTGLELSLPKGLNLFKLSANSNESFEIGICASIFIDFSLSFFDKFELLFKKISKIVYFIYIY